MVEFISSVVAKLPGYSIQWTASSSQEPAFVVGGVDSTARVVLQCCKLKVEQKLDLTTGEAVDGNK